MWQDITCIGKMWEEKMSYRWGIQWVLKKIPSQTPGLKYRHGHVWRLEAFSSMFLERRPVCGIFGKHHLFSWQHTDSPPIRQESLCLYGMLFCQLDCGILNFLLLHYHFQKVLPNNFSIIDSAQSSKPHRAACPCWGQTTTKTSPTGTSDQSSPYSV